MKIKVIQDIIDAARGKGVEKRLPKDYGVPYNSLPPPSSSSHKYKKIIATMGYGNSGSGAILDYLTEFNNTTVCGYHDTNGSGFSGGICEFCLFTETGGIFNLEDAFMKNTNSSWDFLANLFLENAEKYYRMGGIFNDDFWRLSNEFIDSLTEFKFPYTHLNTVTKYPVLKFPYWGGWKYSFTPKNLSVEDYQKIAKKYIKDFLNTIDSKEYLVLDHALSTTKSDMEKYIDDFYILCSCRDPRDIYATSIIYDVSWMPKDPEIFVKWYLNKQKYKTSRETSPRFFWTRFEDFILNHDEVSKKINDFVGLNEENHVLKNKYLILEKSRKNIGIYKDIDDKKAITYIENKLKDCCYN